LHSVSAKETAERSPLMTFPSPLRNLLLRR
jgi:hypothetical protein